jgi:hypothetical protein
MMALSALAPSSSLSRMATMALSACSQFRFHCTEGHSDTVGVAMDQQPDLFGSFSSMLRPSTPVRIAGLFFQSSAGLFPYLLIIVCSGLNRYCCQAYWLYLLLRLCLCGLQDVDIPLHGIDSLAADLVAANSLVNVG